MKKYIIIGLSVLILPSLHAACPNGKTYPVTLTFDDGPHSVLTPKVLDVLKEEKIKATFFVLGKHFPGGKANPAKKEWKKLAESDCVSFAKLSVKADSVTFTCVETDKKGDEVETKRKVTLKGVTLSRPGEITLPIVKVEKDNLSAELMGESFEWKQLKVGLNKEEKIFSP